MDAMVLAAQQWVNAQYSGRSGYKTCPETGTTGWSVMYSLTRALQLELGLTSMADAFGPSTTAAMDAHGPVTASTANSNIRKIVQAALYCKGYPGGGIDGIWGTSTISGIQSMKGHMGLDPADISIPTKAMKSLLTMDAYLCIWGGDQIVRQAQQWLNRTYIDRRDFQILPCDGLFSRNAQKGILYALQYSLGMADGTATGTFGPSTKSGLKSHELAVAASDAGTGHFVRLFKTLLLCNRQVGVDWDSTTYTSTTQAVTRMFQNFSGLSATGRGDYQTWCSLLVSTGDPERPAEGADCMSPLNADRIQALKAGSYKVVGRYIAGGENKRMTAGEAELIIRSGLGIFPIFQEVNNAAQYFSKDMGRRQAIDAITNATELAIPQGSIIYFPCDWDPTSEDIRIVVLPYYEGVRDVMAERGNPYRVGVYGTRNTCQQVSDAGLAVTSFVSGLSTGWSGNLGFPLPDNWAFDQIATVTMLGQTPNEWQIDRNVVSGRDPGVISLNNKIDPNVSFFDWLRAVEAKAAAYKARTNSPYCTQWLTAMVLRSFYTRYMLPDFNILCGTIDPDWFMAAYEGGLAAPPPLYDPVVGFESALAHMGSTVCSSFQQPLPAARTGVTLHDFGGWLGDLITVTKEYYSELSASDEATAYRAGITYIGGASGLYGKRDIIADTDAEVAWATIQRQPNRSLSDILVELYSSTNTTRAKYQNLIAQRFGDVATMRQAAEGALNPSDDDPINALWRAALWAGQPVANAAPALYDEAYTNAPQVFTGMARAFADVMARYAA